MRLRNKSFHRNGKNSSNFDALAVSLDKFWVHPLVQGQADGVVLLDRAVEEGLEGAMRSDRLHHIPLQPVLRRAKRGAWEGFVFGC